MTARQLRAAEAAYQTAAKRYDQAVAARKAAVRQALAEGWTHQQVADLIGMSRGRVSQLKAAA